MASTVDILSKAIFKLEENQFKFFYTAFEDGFYYQYPYSPPNYSP